MGRKLLFGTGRAQVEFPREHYAAVDAVLERALPRTKRHMDKTVKRIARFARNAWPVALKNGGKTRDSIEHGLRIEGNSVVAFVRVRDPRAYHEKVGVRGLRAGQMAPRGKRIAQVLVFGPGRRAVGELVKATADELSRLAGG